MARLPCQWLYLDGFTFRWGRDDYQIDVLKGDAGATHDYDDKVASFKVADDWKDIKDLRYQARVWLKKLKSTQEIQRRKFEIEAQRARRQG
ncbi:hypothetical protein [Saccharopolyspora sp. ASAGF58]|uniref:hypothetical protein n=1 Tax=Saccharopolyspora sp. ASAGF58 TaxID=2719023 RepID=UPI00143FE3B9|nr:hypothetical protein [Saccharopolyspora sp. ASAGF58]QIZ34235.1 hypothetical protein FDZ84_05150 [Saccharopolyspora sp. ASAGF58]